jgi:hypothetical protein
MKYTIHICDCCGKGNRDGVLVSSYSKWNIIHTGEYTEKVEYIDTGEYCKQCLEKAKKTFGSTREFIKE